MTHRATPLVLLVWLLLLGIAGALCMLFAAAPPTEFGPGEREPVDTGAASRPLPAVAVWTLTGRVRRSDGWAVAGARIDIAGRRVETGRDGRFTLVVPRDQKCTVMFDTPTPEKGRRYLRGFRSGVLPQDGTLGVRPTRDPRIEVDCGRARAGDTALELRLPAESVE